MILDWSEYRIKELTDVKEVGQLSPDTVKGYIELGSTGQKKDLLGAKNRELIALAVAVTAGWVGCIRVHADAALRHGATRGEIAEALRVTAAVNSGIRQLKRAAVGQGRVPLGHEIPPEEVATREWFKSQQIDAAFGIPCDDGLRAVDTARPSGDSSRTGVRPGMPRAPNP